MEKKKIKVIDIIAPIGDKKDEKLVLLRNQTSEKKENILIRKIEDNEVKASEIAAEKEIPAESKIEEKPKEINLERRRRIEENFLKEENIEISQGSKFKKYAIYFLALLILSGLAYGVLKFLPKVDIKIIAKKSNWDFNDSISIFKSAGSIDSSNRQIPAEIFYEKRNLTFSDNKANGKKQVERKSSGEITIYNSYSSKPQTLIKETKFETPDGKIFLLDKRVVVPGAKVEEGKIIASSVNVLVTAEKSGDQYNVGPIERFSIPGFKGTAKYNGFYASSNEPMKGGFVGEIFYPTEEDVKAAREKTAAALKENINAFLVSQIPQDFKIVEGARQFNILKENIDKEADQNGNFSASIEGELIIIAFKENDVLSLMSNLAKFSLGDNFEVKNYQLEYGVGRSDFNNKKLSLAIDYKGIFWQPINIENFKNSVLGKKENELKIYIFSLAGIEKATVSFWPFWVKTAPDKINKIKVEVE